MQEGTKSLLNRRHARRASACRGSSRRPCHPRAARPSATPQPLRRGAPPRPPTKASTEFALPPAAASSACRWPRPPTPSRSAAACCSASMKKSRQSRSCAASVRVACRCWPTPGRRSNRPSATRQSGHYKLHAGARRRDHRRPAARCPARLLDFLRPCRCSCAWTPPKTLGRCAQRGAGGRLRRRPRLAAPGRIGGLGDYEQRPRPTWPRLGASWAAWAARSAIAGLGAGTWAICSKGAERAPPLSRGLDERAAPGRLPKRAAIPQQEHAPPGDCHGAGRAPTCTLYLFLGFEDEQAQEPAT